VLDSFKKKICARCLCVHPTRFFSLHCHGCDQVYFCSQECYEQGNHHFSSSTTSSKSSILTPLWICSALRKLATLKKVDRHEKSVAKLVLLIYWQREKEQMSTLSSSSFEKGGNDNNNDKENADIVILSSTFEQVTALESHYNDWSQPVKQDWYRTQQFLEKQLVGKYDNKEDIMHLISKIESNSFGIYLNDNKNKGEPVGRALFPIASLFNHDCNNNCEAEQITEDQDTLEQFEQKEEIVPDPKNPEQVIRRYYYPDVFSQTRGNFRSMLIRTVQQVNPDDPLTISYIDSSLPVSARRQKLKQDYYFDCQCARCINELSVKKL
ncbi:hypothetical protein INT45_004577, partial [Circinella minor]